MCGIAGSIHDNGKIHPDTINRMLQCLKHRGPDDEGVWFSDDQTVALGQRRLAIIDLSSGGRQPRVSRDGRFTIVFNGEIYNYQELKRELVEKGYSFDSSSDTEVLLYAFIEWQELCLEKLNGMFAFAVWDSREKKLFAARDRVGKKPFKYFFNHNRFVFASEIKSLLSDSTIDRTIDFQAIDEALTFSYAPAPRTGFTHIHKLPAGHYLWWQRNTLSIKEYWNPTSFEVNTTASYAQWKYDLWKLFLDGVEKRMISDVPLGAFLSGGIDSSSVVAAMSEVSTSPIDTFVISIGGESEDERMARVVSKFFKTNHHELHINPGDLPDIMMHIADHYDEPFFDQSAIPSLIISREMKKYVTVVLSGDGADELFGGYKNYRFVTVLQHYQRIPNLIRQIMMRMAKKGSHRHYQMEILQNDFFSAYTEYCALWKKNLPESHFYLTKDDLYTPEFKKAVDSERARAQMHKWFDHTAGKDIVSQAMIADFPGRLAEGYLAKIDSASMASGLEVRSPFLDYRLVEKALQLPVQHKIRGKIQKYIWKDIVAAKLPREIIQKPKRGFAFPLNTSISRELRPLVEDTVLSATSRIGDFFLLSARENMWRDHINGRADYSNHIWSLVMLELWMRKYQK